ncbi:DNA/RNA helicase domain-containing protein [Methanobrevibacter sp.]
MFVLKTFATNDNNIYRINSYRVLLTRGREGFIIFVPPTAKLDSY